MGMGSSTLLVTHIAVVQPFGTSGKKKEKFKHKQFEGFQTKVLEAGVLSVGIPQALGPLAV